MSVAVLLALAHCTAAAGGAVQGKVTSVIVRASDGLVYVNVAGTASGRPPCAQNTSYWMIRDEKSIPGKQQLAALMMARKQ